MPLFNSVKDAEKAMNALTTATKVIGVGKLVTSPTPLGVGAALANVASKEMTGKSLGQHAMDYARQNIKPATGTGNVGRSRKGDVISEGGSFRDPQQKNIIRGRSAKGGLISYKSIADMESKGGR